MSKDKPGSRKYIGDGQWIPGVPARDLSPEEGVEFAEVIAQHEAAGATVIYGPPQPQIISKAISMKEDVPDALVRTN